MFPVINHISDVLPHIEGDKSFAVIDKGDHTIIDYVIEQTGTFPPLSEGVGSYMRRECRGIAFDENGYIARRGFQKFFNCGQNEESLVQNIDFSIPHLVMDKADGSFVFNINLKRGNVLGTRKGETDVALMAEKFVDDNPEIRYRELINYLSMLGYTTFFEFFCKDNMIVIDYGDPRMVLLGARRMRGGEYMRYEVLNDLSKEYNVPIIEVFDVDLSDPSDFLAAAKQEKEKEGYVIRFENGYSVKVKGDWYVQLHHTISGLNTNRNISRLLLDNSIDDILPILPDRRRESVEEFAKQFWSFYSGFSDRVKSSWSDILEDSNDNWGRKNWALRIKKEDPYYMGLMFKFLDAEQDIDKDKAIKGFVMSKMNKEIVFDGFCEYAGFEFS